MPNCAVLPKNKILFHGLLCKDSLNDDPRAPDKRIEKTHQIAAHPHASSKYITKDCIIRRWATSTNAASIQTHGSSRFSTVRGIFSLSPFTGQVTRSVAAVSAHSFPLDKAEKLGAYEPLKRRISTVGIHAASNGEKK